MKVFPLTQFSDLGLAESVLSAVKAEGYTVPTPIQSKAIPLLLEGRDVVGIAQTGTGKTAAFVLPLLSRLADNRAAPKPKCAAILVLAPTRELAAQIAESVAAYGAKMRVTVAVVVGGVKPGPQIRTMARGVDVLVATPGRLLDHMSSNAISLNQTRAVVMDEADQMMDLGFLPAIRKIMAAAPKSRQTLLFSATMPKPVRALANDFLNNPEEIAVTPQAKPADKVEQAVYLIKSNTKLALLGTVLAEPAVDRAIVFTRTKHGADKVVAGLAAVGLKAEAIHGNKSQGQRVRALDNFKSGKAPILVATDIAARGLDIDGVSHVVNYDMPHQSESYVHRIGRTARAGKTGIAISFTGNDERTYLKDIEKLIGRKIDRLAAPEGTALDLSLPEDTPPHTMQSRMGRGRSQGGGGGGGGGRSGGKPGGGRAPHRGKASGSFAGDKSGGAGGGRSGGNRRSGAPSKSRSWSPS